MNNMYAGRAGEKLETALNHFKINVRDLVCADFGSAIGGFVDCLMQKGAKKVYAVEKGYGVLDWKLRHDQRVVVLERTNAMHVKLPELVDLITIDTSWTKQINVAPNAIKNLKPGGIIISLIKPHYEAEKKDLVKGRLKTEKVAEVVGKVIGELEKLGLKSFGLMKSPILGEKGGNVEYLAYFFK